MATATACEIRLTTIAKLRAGADRLIAAHYDEVARRKDLMQLSPDWDRYQLADDAGKLLCLGAFIGDELVGYAVTILANHLHYSRLLFAQNDVLFLEEQHRRGRIGPQLIAQTERLAREAGAKFILWHAKQGTALERLLPRLGYEVHEVMWGKEV